MSMPTAGGRLRPLWWIALALLVLIADFLTGPFIHLPVLFLFPVTLATWFSGKRHGLAMATVLPMVRISFAAFWTTPWGMLEATVNGFVEMLVLAAFTLLVDQAVQKKALYEEIRVLRGILPICSFCKNIRNEDGVWQPLEQYIGERSDAQFSHGICRPCAKEHYGEFVEKAEKHRRTEQS